MADTYYGTAGKDADQGLAKILEATKIAGKAGQDAYNEAAGGMDARQKEALAQASGADAFLGGGSTLFHDRAVQQDTRFRNAIDTARAGYTQGLEGTKASATSYFGKLKAALPALQAQNSQALASKEARLAGAQQKAQAKEEKTKIIGETQAELDALLKERDELRGTQPQLKEVDKSWQPGGFNAKPLEDQIKANNDRIAWIDRTLAHDGRGTALAGGREAGLAEKQHLLERNTRFQNALDKQRGTGAYAPDKLGEAFGHKTDEIDGFGAPLAPQQLSPATRLRKVEERIAEIQASRERPSEISNRIAVDKYKWDPALAKGTFTDALWQPMTNATEKAMAPQISAMAASLAGKGDILLGQDEIESILQDKNVQEDIADFKKKSGAGEMTLSEADEELRSALLGEDAPENGYEIYQVMRGIIGTMGWKKEKR